MATRVTHNSENRYAAIIGDIFAERHEPGSRQLAFDREDIVATAAKLNIPLPKNVGDVVYSFRYRSPLPARILQTATEGKTWIIRPAGRGRYRFALVDDVPLEPNPNLAETKVPDATPGMIAKYAFGNEQGVLARIRYNRLLDVFLGAHYVMPVQAKGGNDKLSQVQIEQDIALCAEKLPDLICRPIGTQWMRDGVVALFEFEEAGDRFRVVAEKHYRLVSPNEITAEELMRYRRRLADDA